MPIKLLYKQAMSQNLRNAFQRLVHVPRSVAQAKQINKLSIALEKTCKVINDEYMADILGPNKSEDGGVMPERMEAFKAAQDAFGEKECVVDQPLLPLHVLDGVQMSAAEYAGIEPLLMEECKQDVTDNVIPMVGASGPKEDAPQVS